MTTFKIRGDKNQSRSKQEKTNEVVSTGLENLLDAGETEEEGNSE